MTQPIQPTSNISLDSLRERSVKLAEGIANLRQNIGALQHRTSQLQANLFATQGAKDYVDELIKELTAPKELKGAAPTPEAEKVTTPKAE